jgi:hypothetical protein
MWKIGLARPRRAKIEIEAVLNLLRHYFMPPAGIHTYGNPTVFSVIVRKNYSIRLTCATGIAYTLAKLEKVYMPAEVIIDGTSHHFPTGRRRYRVYSLRSLDLPATTYAHYVLHQPAAGLRQRRLSDCYAGHDLVLHTPVRNLKTIRRTAMRGRLMRKRDYNAA